jgi:hypothetical protein
MTGLATDANIFDGSALGQPIAHHSIHVAKGLSNAACCWLGHQRPLSQAPKRRRNNAGRRSFALSSLFLLIHQQQRPIEESRFFKMGK